MSVVLGLRPEQLLARRGYCGGSDAPTIANGSDEDLLKKYLEKTGDKEPDDLSDVLPVQMGLFTEPLNRAWYTKQTGRAVTDVGGELFSFEYPWMSVTLDGLTTLEDGSKAVFQAKHVNAFSDPEDIKARYFPQVQHEMVVTETNFAVLAVFYGNHKWEHYVFEKDEAYCARLIEAERKFMECVKNRIPPVASRVETPKGPPVRIVDMHGNNAWATAAFDWLETKPHADRFNLAVKALKALAPEDAKETFGHGVRIARNKAGSATIKEG